MSSWIKVSTSLGTHPKVVRIASALKADRLRVVGGLHAVWCLFDEHSEDGRLDGYTPEVVDELIGWPGFTAGMAAVGWAEETEEGLVLPRFERHNGQSAKRRAMDSDRKRAARKVSASKADEKRTREDKIREEKKEQKQEQKQEHGQQAARTPSRFDEFWAVYPNKKGKADAAKAWKRKRLDAKADAIIADVKARMKGDGDWLDGFIPHGSTYVNGERWLDDIVPPKRNGQAGGYVALPGEI